jgi:hypothetical protein
MELKILKADVMKKNPFLTKLAKLSYSGFLWLDVWLSASQKESRYIKLIHHHHHQWQNTPFWATDFLRYFCKSTPGFHFFKFRNNIFFTEQACRPWVQPPTPGGPGLCIYVPQWQGGPVLKTEINGRGDPLRWPRDTLYPQKLALTSPTSGGRSVGIVRLRTKSHGVREWQGGPVILPGTGFRFRRLLRLARLQRKCSNPPSQ